jgi:LysR family cyn operon transcriptional activator
MELRHLRYFLAVAERLSFTQAAAKVHVTQSTLSHQISQLEAELGHLLFERKRGRVTLTAAGGLFLPKAVKALAELDSGIAIINEATRELTGELRIGTTPTLNMEVIPKCVALFTQQHPSVHVLVDEGAGSQLIVALRAGDFDVLLHYRPLRLEGLLFEPLYSEEMVVVVNPNHAWHTRKRIRVVELHRRELVLPPRKFSTRVQLDEAFEAAGTEPFVSTELSSIAAMLALVQRSPIAAIVSRSAVPAHLGLHVIALEGPAVARTPGLIWLAGAARAPVAVSFAAIVRGAVSQSGLQPDGG